MLDLVISESLAVFEPETAYEANVVFEMFADFLVPEKCYLFLLLDSTIGDNRSNCEFIIVVVDDYIIGDVLMKGNYLQTIKQLRFFQ